MAEEETKKTAVVKVIELIEKMTVLELAELTKALEEKFGVSPMPVMAAGVAPVAAAATGSGEVAPAEEQTTFNVVLTNFGANKIGVIKAVREIVPTLGLKEAKDLVEAAPKPVLEGVSKEQAAEAEKKLKAAGATAEVK
jgi:large subunit ribosomal protein L7/L12